MALTYLDWDGSTPSIEVPIPCLNKSHMFAYATTLKGDGTVDVGNVALIPNNVTYNPDSGYCTFSWLTAPNRSIRFLRSTPYTHVLHDFGNGTVFNLEMYIQQQKQMLYLWQESVETKNLVSVLSEGSDCSVVENLWKSKYERDVQAAFNAGKSYVDSYTLSALMNLSGGTTNPASTLLGVYGTSRVPVPDFNSVYVGNRTLEQALFGYMQDIQTAPLSTNITVGDLNINVSSGKAEAQSALLTRARALLGDKFSAATVRGTTVTSSVASTLLERMLYGYAFVGQNPETVRTVAQNWQGESGVTETNPAPVPSPDPDPAPSEPSDPAPSDTDQGESEPVSPPADSDPDGAADNADTSENPDVVPPAQPAMNSFVLAVDSSEFPVLDAREAAMVRPMVSTVGTQISTDTSDYSLDTFLTKYEDVMYPLTGQWYSGSLLLAYLYWLDSANLMYMNPTKVQSYAKKKLAAAGIEYTGEYVVDMVNVQEPLKNLLTTWYLLAKWSRGGTSALYDEYEVLCPPLQPIMM